MTFSLVLLTLCMVVRNDAQLSLSSTTGNVQKPYNLTVLALLTFTGNDPRDGKLCQKAMEVAVEAVNNRSDFLSDYNVIPIFKDEGTNANFAVRETVNFLRQYPATAAPAIVGPFFSNGCQRLASSLHYFDTLNFALACSATVLSANRQAYPNLYHVRAQGEIVMYSRFLFVKQVGQWSKVAIVTAAASLRDVSGAIAIQQLFLASGIEVPWFNAVLDYDASLMQSLIASDLRAMVLEIATTSVIIRFLCVAYLNGLTGSRYVFLALTSVMFDPYQKLPVLEPGCKREHLVEQLKYTFFISHYLLPHKNHGVSSLGYDLMDYDKMIRAKAGPLIETQDKIMLHTCHDGMLMALLSLDLGEKILRQTNNSLRDYASKPSLVADAVNRSAATMEPFGLRIGRQVWSRRLELDEDFQSVVYWNDAKRKFDVLFVVEHDPSRDYFDPNSYTMTQLVSELPWQSANKKPPVAFPSYIVERQEPSQNFMTFIEATGAAIASAQLLGVLFLAKFRKVDFDKVLILASCFLINASAAAFVEPQWKEAICALQVVFVLLGLGGLNCAIMMKTLRFYNKPIAMPHVRISFAANEAVIEEPNNMETSGHLSGGRMSEMRKPSQISSMMADNTYGNIFTYSISLAQFLGFLVLLVVWLVLDLPTPRLININGHSIYDYDKDVYINVEAYSCIFVGFARWLGASCCLQVLNCIIVTFVLISRRNYRRSSTDLKPYAAVSINLMVLLAAALMLNYIMDGKPTAQAIVNSLVALTISVASFILAFSKDFQSVLETAKRVSRHRETTALTGTKGQSHAVLPNKGNSTAKLANENEQP